MSKDWEGELNHRFLKVEAPPIVKVTDSSLAGFIWIILWDTFWVL